MDMISFVRHLYFSLLQEKSCLSLSTIVSFLCCCCWWWYLPSCPLYSCIPFSLTSSRTSDKNTSLLFTFSRSSNGNPFYLIQQEESKGLDRHKSIKTTIMDIIFSYSSPSLMMMVSTVDIKPYTLSRKIPFPVFGSTTIIIIVLMSLSLLMMMWWTCQWE